MTTGGGSGAVWDFSGAALPDGRVLLVWTQQDGANDKVYARFRLADGALTTPVVISGGNNAPLNPKVINTGVGRIVVTMTNLNSPNKVWSNTYDDDAGTWSDAGIVGGGALPQAAVGAAGEVGILFGYSETNVGTRSAFFTVGGGWQAEETLTTSSTSSGYAGAVAWNDAVDQFVAITGIDQSFVIRTRANAAGAWSGTSTFWTPPGSGAVDQIRVAYDPSGNGAALWSWCPVYKSCDVYANVFAAGSGWKTPRQLDHSDHQSSVVMSLARKTGVNAFFMAGWRQGTSGSTANIRASQIGVAGTFSAAATLGVNQIVSALACDEVSCTVFATPPNGCTLPTWICK
jgi:hypothetical protein